MKTKQEKEKNFVSAVIYIHNDASRLEEFLKLVCGTLMDNFLQAEVICVNDASSDDSVDVIRKFSKIRYDAQKPAPDVPERVPVNNEIGIVRNIAARSSEMDDARSRRRDLAVCIYVGHDIVSDFLLPEPYDLVIDVSYVRFKLCDLLFRDRKAQSHLLPGQCHPEASPGLIPGIRRKESEHVVRCVS